MGGRGKEREAVRKKRATRAPGIYATPALSRLGAVRNPQQSGGRAKVLRPIFENKGLGSRRVRTAAAMYPREEHRAEARGRNA